jgi:hypothetical protein
MACEAPSAMSRKTADRTTRNTINDTGIFFLFSIPMFLTGISRADPERQS